MQTCVDFFRCRNR